ncbi:BTB/POZ domain-containing protein KCTD7 isoform X2 [Protopterus annectens]|uniref:BTB/POZ domain-containing protein KCTD7 isoform X2 n=1 Tax=Protopterus annectens TaxID=7888 RepID=UPI001CFBEEA9|nr:BTB/POZ domain-containing protein KCTD7 isoform X2 [Protopterus annectens]
MVVHAGQQLMENSNNAMSTSNAGDEFSFIKPDSLNTSSVLHPLKDNLEEFPEVVSLNVGGMYYTTRLSTLRRFEDSMLAVMFSGRHRIPKDTEGRYFIDRDGKYFGDVLNFLRNGDLPPREHVRAVYREAQYYSLGPLQDTLEEVQPLAGEKVRQAFLDLMPYYKDALTIASAPVC